MIKMENIQIGNKFIIDNRIGLFNDIEKSNLVAEVIEKIDDKKVKVKIKSILMKSEVEKEIEYFLLQ